MTTGGGMKLKVEEGVQPLRRDKADAKKPTAGRKPLGFRPGGPRTSSFRSRRLKLTSPGSCVSVPFAGRWRSRQTTMCKHNTTATTRSLTNSIDRRTKFTSEDVSSKTEVNSQTARQRVDTSLSSLRSLRSLGWYRCVERLPPLHPHTSPLERSERSELRGEIRLSSVGFTSSLRFGTQAIRSELGGER